MSRPVAACSTRFLLCLAVAVLLVPTSLLRAAEPLRPIRATSPPAIDGVLDDAVWQRAPSVTGFKTWMPDFGKPMTDETVAYYAYDSANLYFAFRALDSEPAKIKASMASRDTVSRDDWICINLDSFNDQQSLYGFYVNPLGIQMDSRYVSGREDFGFDLVWQSAGRVDERGFTIEVRIPFKSIRYQSREPVTMGVVLERFISRRKEDGTWPALDPKAGVNFLIQMNPIQFTGIKHYKLLEVLPDVTWARQQAASGGALASTSSGSDIGVSAKYGLTAQLTADGAWNPDFSQVEADAGQIDINRRAPLYFAEKRPFFLEGREALNLGGPSQSGPLESVFHTRTIADPLAGVKISGKLSANDTLASMYVADRLPADSAGDQELVHVGVLRYKRALNQDSYVGGVYTAREHAAAYNRVAGVDGSLRVNRSAAFGFYALGSATRASDQSSADTGRALGVDFTHSTRRLEVVASGLDISTDFNTETGYTTRTGITKAGVSVSPRFYPSNPFVRRIVLTGAAYQARDAASGIRESSNLVSASFMLPGSATVAAQCAPSTEVYTGQRFGTTACTVSASAQVAKQLYAQGSVSEGQAIYYATDPFGGRSTLASATLIFQPSEQWSETLSATYANFEKRGSGERLYDYGIFRSRTTFQVSRYFVFRGIVEYNSFRRQLLTDFLASFTYIPGTVIHAGYGSLYEKTRWNGERYVPSSSLAESRRGLFFKASYLWRL
jgi:hypothetical protein